MTIIPYSAEWKHILSLLITDYFTEMDSDIPSEILSGDLIDLIHRQCTEHIIHVDLVKDGSDFLGFSIYQIDTPESDWCKRPGWGFIREFYVVPEHRSTGIGKALAHHAETRLHSLGAKNLYLTADNAISFWQKCGWKLTGELCSNELYILEK